MKLAISNIAWNPEDESTVIGWLKQFGVKGLEIAPTKIWQDPTQYKVEEALACKQSWSEHGLELVAMQSLLFGRANLVLFQDEVAREALKQYLFVIIELAGVLGTKKLVFGSPKNRLAGKLSKQEQIQIAAPFFYELGEHAMKHNVLFCIEPNAKEYGCDFVTNTDEAIELLEIVNHKGFQLHLDAAVMTMNGENYVQVIQRAIPHLAHFHISEPFLNLIGSEHTNHHAIFAALVKNQYSNWVSIEMKNGLSESNSQSVRKSLEFVTQIYK